MSEEIRAKFEEYKNELRAVLYEFNEKQAAGSVDTNHNYSDYESGYRQAVNDTEERVFELENNLKQAINRIKDMLMADDGQAYKEAEKFLGRIKKDGGL